MNFSIMFDKDKCKCCTNCIKRCPTQAIRLVDGKAFINNDKCIHCGECIKVCPYNAYTPEPIEWYEEMHFSSYKHKIAISSTPLYGQFPKGTDICKVQNSILKLGFDSVYDASWAAEMVGMAIKRKINEEKIRPFISTNCPAVVRLIKNRYPSLMDHLILIKEPMVIAAMLAREKAKKKLDLKDDEIGVFYLSPCPAKLLAVTDPVGDYKPYVDWVIPLNTIYGELYRELVKGDNGLCSHPSLNGTKWAVSGGQSESAGLTNYIAVNGMENIIQILDEVENGNLTNVDYVETLACVQGCVGGTFNVINPFIAQSNINYILGNTKDESIIEELDEFDEMYESGVFKFSLKPEENQGKFNMKEAIIKREKIKEIYDKLPGLDCGSCGAPTCYAHAEDIYNNESTLYNCVVLRANKITEEGR
uniref:[Fe-Fe] hydrogenase large subunit C-terminal domain-containing protein n=1 Tax=unclassified Sedimentibacter TaxID=2649220 RepID=UPI0027E18DFC|nr:[Fe-Fe] hydrogenase large subunit C-terminal domain-containing protein [Sedimentibacter sp. MB35-C1]WMJ75897.1 [Fe-Fe] hydrogenase large subunit C-terminal domain-containing protein [Sedimentibacter sp. MB35-C1]